MDKQKSVSSLAKEIINFQFSVHFFKSTNGSNLKKTSEHREPWGFKVVSPSISHILIFSWDLWKCSSGPCDGYRARLWIWHQRTDHTSKPYLGTKNVGTWLPCWTSSKDQVRKGPTLPLFKRFEGGTQRKLLPQLEIYSYLKLWG